MARFLYYVQDRQKAPPSDRPRPQSSGLLKAALYWTGGAMMLATVGVTYMSEPAAVEWHTGRSFDFQIHPPLIGEPYSVPCLTTGSRVFSGASWFRTVEDLKLSRCYERT
jgi:hypothetical protein